MMNKYKRKGFLLHAKSKEYKSKLKYSLQIIREAFEGNSCYVSFSGGKDSAVLTHLALSVDSNAWIWHWDYGDDLMPRQIEKEVLDNLGNMGAVNIVVNKRKGDGADTSSGYKQFFKQIQLNKNEYGWDMGLVGVRRAESTTRKNKYVNHFQDGDCYPLLDWSFEDVWAYIVSNNVPYPHVYDVYSSVVGYENSRFVTFFDPEFETLSYGLDGVLMDEFRYF